LVDKRQVLAAGTASCLWGESCRGTPWVRGIIKKPRFGRGRNVQAKEPGMENKRGLEVFLREKGETPERRGKMSRRSGNLTLYGCCLRKKLEERGNIFVGNVQEVSCGGGPLPCSKGVRFEKSGGGGVRIGISPQNEKDSRKKQVSPSVGLLWGEEKHSKKATREGREGLTDQRAIRVP